MLIMPLNISIVAVNAVWIRFDIDQAGGQQPFLEREGTDALAGGFLPPLSQDNFAASHHRLIQCQGVSFFGSLEDDIEDKCLGAQGGGFVHQPGDTGIFFADAMDLGHLFIRNHQINDSRVHRRSLLQRQPPPESLVQKAALPGRQRIGQEQ